MIRSPGHLPKQRHFGSSPLRPSKPKFFGPGGENIGSGNKPFTGRQMKSLLFNMVWGGNWGRLHRKLGRSMIWTRKIMWALLVQISKIAQKVMKAQIRQGPMSKKKPHAHAKLAKYTRIFKQFFGFPKPHTPLMRTFSMERAVGISYFKPLLTSFVGVYRSTRWMRGPGRGSKTPANINVALLHEYGTRSYYIKVTKRMRGWFEWLSKVTGGKIKPLRPYKYLKHPGLKPRPFVAPTLQIMQAMMVNGQPIMNRFSGHIIKELII